MQEVTYVENPIAWYRCVAPLGGAVLLDGSASERAEYDIISAAPSILIRGFFDRVEVTEGGVTQCYPAEQLFDLLKRYRNPMSTNGLPFNGGLIGYFAYEIGELIEALKVSTKQDDAQPVAEFARYDWAVVQSHTQRKAWLLNPESAPKDFRFEPLGSNDCSELTLPPSQWRARTTASEYRSNVERIHDYIRAGDCYQVNYTQCFETNSTLSGLDIYTSVAKVAKAPFHAFLQTRSREIISVSPERLVAIKGNKITAQPIKGTAARSNCSETDQHNANALVDSIKDRSENLMIVDLLRNDIGRVAAIGSVKVPKIFELQSFTNVHHLVSTIEATLGEPYDAIDLLQATLPGGSITGAPKIRAMEIINELEQTPRGPYCGSIVYISDCGEMDASICIRTIEKVDTRLRIWGGGAIVIDSDVDSEQAESRTKISAFIKALNGEILPD